MPALDDLTVALGLTAALSILLVVIELAHHSQQKPIHFFNAEGFIYLLIVAVGNIAATLTASAFIPAFEPKWFFLAFFGVFGFQALVKNMNLSFKDQGLLTIEEWISKAQSAAAAAAVESGVASESKKQMKLARSLADRLSLEEINSHLAANLGAEAAAEYVSIARRSSGNEAIIKALALATQRYQVASHIEASGPSEGSR
ncbi:hypothetical protein [Xanthomonas citri]|uniref:hypothetical protein n=1 Tax=Xanthomonas citri TaxID=346 RepID=UPI001C0466EC|nr:hypothetical protein [Xanthomonas citri]